MCMPDTQLRDHRHMIQRYNRDLVATLGDLKVKNLVGTYRNCLHAIDIQGTNP
jgi:hypothetical protein